MKKSRANNLDLLRILCTIAVIIIHVNYLFFQLRALNPMLTKWYILESMLNTITRFSVPCFVMLSGAFLLNNSDNKNPIYFYKKSLLKIFYPTLFVLVLYIFLDIIIFRDISYKDLFLNIITGNYYNLWYMYMLMGLYLLIPFILIIKENVNKRDFTLIAFVLTIWAILSQMNSSYLSGIDLGVVFSFVSYLLWGDILYYKFKNQKINNCVIIVVFILCNLISIYGRYIGYNKYIFDAYIGFFSPTVYISSICVFVFFVTLNITKDFSYLSSLTFYIYLFHTIVYRVTYNLLYAIWIRHELLSILIVTLTTFLISCIIAIVFKKIIDICTIKIENKYTS